ncbi:hypothetical protein PENTCL1PPCAC_11866, partial [Pristionchus entomophagus]
SFSSTLSQISWLQLRLIPERKSRFWTALRSSPNGSLREDASRKASIYNPSWSYLQPEDNDNLCVAIGIFPITESGGGWQFAQCDVPLPIICPTFACIGS